MPGGIEAVVLFAACFSAAASVFSHRLAPPGHHNPGPHDENWLPQPQHSPQETPQETQQPFPQPAQTQIMLGAPRGKRDYDVPQIECPTAPEDDAMERFACPTPDRMGRYRCIGDHVLCDGFIDCPSGEDEDRQACMFYRTTKAHLDILADALLRWARGR